MGAVAENNLERALRFYDQAILAARRKWADFLLVSYFIGAFIGR